MTPRSKSMKIVVLSFKIDGNRKKNVVLSCFAKKIDENPQSTLPNRIFLALWTLTLNLNFKLTL